MPGVEERAYGTLGCALALAACLTGCRDGPAGAPPLVAPDAAARTSAFFGSPLSGPRPEVPPELTPERCDPASAWRLEVEWFVVPSVPGLGLDALAPWTRLVVVDPDLAPTLGPSLLAPGAVVGRVPDAEDFLSTLRARSDALHIATQTSALPEGVTAVLELTQASLLGVSAPTRIALLVHRPAPGGRRPSPAPPSPVPPAPESTTLSAGAPRAATGPVVAAALGGLAGALGDGPPAPSPATLAASTGAGPSRPWGAAQLALDLVGRPPGEDPCKPGPLRRELLLLDEVLEPVGEALVLVTPSPIAGPGFPPLLAVVARVREAPVAGDPGRTAHRAALVAALATLQREGAPLAPSPSAGAGPVDGPLTTGSLEAARLALRDPREQRRALLALAAAADAELLNMFALTGEHALVDPIARLLADRLAEAGAPRGGPALRWLLERTVVDVARRAYPAADVPPGLESILGRYAGAVAQRAVFLVLFDEADDVEELHELLARENAALLDDPAAGIRARAAEWLARERPELLPPGYDPLGTARERQAALAHLRGLWAEDDDALDDVQEDDQEDGR